MNKIKRPWLSRNVLRTKTTDTTNTLSAVYFSTKKVIHLLAVLVQLGELSEQVDERSLAERVLDWGVERNGGVLGAQDCHPFLRYPGWNKINLVQNQDLGKLPISINVLYKFFRSSLR
jgi:hypothetical protein